MYNGLPISPNFTPCYAGAWVSPMGAWSCIMGCSGQSTGGGTLAVAGKGGICVDNTFSGLPTPWCPAYVPATTDIAGHLACFNSIG